MMNASRSPRGDAHSKKSSAKKKAVALPKVDHYVEPSLSSVDPYSYVPQDEQTVMGALKGAERVTDGVYGGRLDTGHVRRQRLERGKQLTDAFVQQSELKKIANSPRYKKKDISDLLGYEPQVTETKKVRYSSPYAVKNLGVTRPAKRAPIKTYQQPQYVPPKPAQQYYRMGTADVGNTEEDGFVNRIYEGAYRSHQQDLDDFRRVQIAEPKKKKKTTTKKKTKARSPSPGLRTKKRVSMAQTLDAYHPVAADTDLYKQTSTQSALEIAKKRNSLSKLATPGHTKTGYRPPAALTGASKFDQHPFQYYDSRKNAVPQTTKAKPAKANMLAEYVEPKIKQHAIVPRIEEPAPRQNLDMESVLSSQILPEQYREPVVQERVAAPELKKDDDEGWSFKKIFGFLSDDK